MKKENTAIRLRTLMNERNIKQVDILNACAPYCKKYDIKMNKSDISQYLSGKAEPAQNKLVILGMALNVSEPWLMGFDVPKERVSVPQSNESPVMKAILSSDNADSATVQEYMKKKMIDKLDFDMIDYEMLIEFQKLNQSGKREAINRIKEFTYVPKYTDALKENVQMVAESSAEYNASK